MNNFKPTWLYIKQHELTKLKYFGKTTSTDPIKYKGSGKYWKDHLKKHGNQIITLWCELFTDKQALIEYAIKFSKDNNIINSNEWANLLDENGLDGWISGRKREFKKRKPLSAEHRQKLSDAIKNKIVSQEEKQIKGKKISQALKGKSNANKGRKLSEETKKKISAGNKGKVRSDQAKLNYSKAKSNVSKETRLKQSIAHLGKTKTIKNKEDVNFANKA